MVELLEMMIKVGTIMIFRNFFRGFREALKNIWRNRGISLASVGSVVATLLILGVIFSIIINVNYLVDDFQDNYEEITVYLEDYVEGTEKDLLLIDISALDGVESVKFIDKEQAMEEWKLQWGDNAYLLDGLDSNPLPNVLIVELKDLERSAVVAKKIEVLSGIEDVKYQPTLVKNIIQASRFVRTVGFVIIMILILITTFIIANTIKIAVNSRRTEINIMKYVGATNWYIRYPFLIEGALIGFVGALIASGLIFLLYNYVYNTIIDSYFVLASSYIVSPKVAMGDLLVISIVLGVGIGVVGSINAMRRHLNV